MKISFGILLEDNYVTQMTQNIVNSIEKQNSITENDYEIIVVGNYRNDVVSRKPLINFSLGNNYKFGWLTKKRNIIIQNAQYENCCIMNNYYMLKQGWYEGLLKYNKEDPDWDILRTKIIKIDGGRWYDWTLDQRLSELFYKLNPNLRSNLNPAFFVNLPYNTNTLNYASFICCGYILAKTQKMLETPSLENIVGWQRIGRRMEDEWWSLKIVSKGYKIKMNTYSTVTLQKYKHDVGNFPEHLIIKFSEMISKEKVIKFYKKLIHGFNM